MSDIRLIDIDQDTGEVTLTGSVMDKNMSPVEEAIQRFIICLFNTQGTMIDAVGWGGNAIRLYLANRAKTLSETRSQASVVISNTMASLRSTEPSGDDYAIRDAYLDEIERTDRGYMATIRIEFSNAVGTSFKIPGKTNVAL